jgi:cell division protein FtsN
MNMMKHHTKRFGIGVCITGIMILLISASVQEGSASVSLNGELPGEGCYVATKSFPKNTVVEIRNLENGQSVQVVVADTLDAPGLLAMLSPDAAKAIGLQDRAVGRVRMTMPSDLVAFSRFTGESSSSGDPDFDPRAAIAAHAPVFAPPSAAQENAQAASPAGEAYYPGPEASPVYPWDTSEYTYTDYPDGSVLDIPGSSMSIVNPYAGDSEYYDYDDYYDYGGYDASDYYDYGDDYLTYADPLDNETQEEDTDPYPWLSPAVDPVVAVTPAERTPPAVLPDVLAREQALTLIPAQGPQPSVEPPVVPEEIPPVGVPAGSLPSSVQTVPDAPVSPVGVPADSLPSSVQTVPDAPVAPAGVPADSLPSPVQTVPDASAAPADVYGLVLIPAEARPPEESSAPSLPPVQERTAVPVPDTTTNAAKIEAQLAAQDRAAPQAADAPFVPSAASAPPEIVNTNRAPGPAFSVPTISALERGKYYLQLGAFSKAETVEAELAKISPLYPLAVQADGSPDRPIYRVLVGPVNVGEGGALLQSFRGTGWKDAYLRNDG